MDTKHRKGKLFVFAFFTKLPEEIEHFQKTKSDERTFEFLLLSEILEEMEERENRVDL